MKILAFDTSHNHTSVAISEGSTILAFVENHTPSSKAEQLIPMIEEVLDISHLTYDDINYIAVTNGPGSFTGIRIGLACAKALLLQNNILSSTVTNFEIYYYRAIEQIAIWDKIIVLINAYRGQIYVAVFDSNGSCSTVLLLNYSEVSNLINEYNSHEQIICIGSGTILVYELINKLPNINVLPRFTKIKAVTICKYISDNIATHVSAKIEPLYIRPPDAKIPNR